MINGRLKIKKGFTLAEVLITLGLVGVIAAATIPIIKGIIPNPNKALFRKSYQTFQNAIENMLNDDKIYPTQMTTKVGDSVFQRGFNYTVDPTGEAGTTNKFCYYLAKNLNIVGSATCPDESLADGRAVEFGTTADGVTWYLYLAHPADQFRIDGYYITKIFVDVNGEKAPNCSTGTIWVNTLPTDHQASSGNTTKCPNPDTFTMYVRYDGKIRVGILDADPTSTVISDQTAIDILKDPMDNTK